MIRLTSPLVFSGRMIPAGAKIGFLTKAQEAALVDAGNGVYIRPQEVQATPAGTAGGEPPIPVEAAAPPAAIEVSPQAAIEAEAPPVGEQPPTEVAHQRFGRDGRGGK